MPQTPLIGENPLTIQFTDISLQSPTSWLWNFGNGQTSTLQTPPPVIFNTGTYTVSLTVTNAGGTNTLTANNYVNAMSVDSFWASMTHFSDVDIYSYFDGCIFTPDGSLIAVGGDDDATSLVNIIKWDNAGTRLWECTIGNPNEWNSIHGECPCIDAQGNIYVIASDQTINSYPDIFKLSPTGTLIWQRGISHIINGTRVSFNHIVSLSTGIVVSAMYQDDTTLQINAILVKISFDGTIVWVKNYNNDSLAIDYGSGKLIVDSQDNIYTSISTDVATVSVLKIDSTGSIIWSKLISTFTDTTFSSISLIADDLFVTVDETLIRLTSAGQLVNQWVLSDAEIGSLVVTAAAGNKLILYSIDAISGYRILSSFDPILNVVEYSYALAGPTAPLNIWYGNSWANAISVNTPGNKIAIAGNSPSNAGGDQLATVMMLPTKLSDYTTGVICIENTATVLPVNNITLDVPATLIAVNTFTLTVTTNVDIELISTNYSSQLDITDYSLSGPFIGVI